MSIGQIVMYHALGLELKYGDPGTNGKKSSSLKDKSAEELREIREELREKYGKIG
jgi:hypothetical protein